MPQGGVQFIRKGIHYLSISWMFMLTRPFRKSESKIVRKWQTVVQCIIKGNLVKSNKTTTLLSP